MKDEQVWVPVEVVWDVELRPAADPRPVRAPDPPLRHFVTEARRERRDRPARAVDHAADRLERRDLPRRHGRPRPRHKKLRPQDLDDLE
ncbi:MAG TPA: hypothetical protein VFL91_33875 [Thermomicrobiales bacterium]|nr:hypothetical protein [Thermomicrobiales bacterium]